VALAALIISTVAMLLTTLVALACLELVPQSGTQATDTADDQSLPIDLSEGVLRSKPSAHGLPSELDQARSHLVLFLSPTCVACRKIAESLAGNTPVGTTIVVTAGPDDRLVNWAVQHGLHTAIIDSGYEIVSSLGLTSSPTVIGIADGSISFGTGISGMRALESLLEQRQGYEVGFVPTDGPPKLAGRSVDESRRI